MNEADAALARAVFTEQLLAAPNTPPEFRGKGRARTMVWPKGSRGWWLDVLDAVNLVEAARAKAAPSELTRRVLVRADGTRCYVYGDGTVDLGVGDWLSDPLAPGEAPWIPPEGWTPDPD